MKHLARSTRRGVALLIVLATLLIFMTAATILVRFAASVQQQRRIERSRLIADDLLRASQAPILHWLDKDSASVVLSPDATSPRVEVLHDAWFAGGLEHELSISAFDQLGMVPLAAIQRGAPLRLTVPPAILTACGSIRQVLDHDKTISAGGKETALGSPEYAGLDWFVGFDSGSEEVRIFPDAVPGDLSETVFFGQVGAVPAAGTIDQLRTQVVAPIALGELVATHNSSPERINVNTAPIGLVQTALRTAGRGGLEQIIASRRAHNPANAGDVPVASNSPQNAVQLVSSSTSWAFRINIRVGPLRRSWWEIYQPTGNKPWECVQRLAINQ